jgi:hypothetical protein
MGAKGLYTHLRLTPYKMGENLFTKQVGAVDNEGYCTGQGMTYHGLQYDRKKAIVTIRIKLSRRKLALGEHENRGFKCSSLKHHCTYPGGVMYWESKDWPAAAIYRGTMFSDKLVYRTPTRREISDAARLHPQSVMADFGSLDKALSDTSFPGNCRSLCGDRPKQRLRSLIHFAREQWLSF